MEYRVLEVHRGRLVVLPLDNVRHESLHVSGATKYVENEVIVAQRLPDVPGGKQRFEVVAARIDPSFIGGAVPKIVTAGEGIEFHFTEYVTYEEGEAFEDALENLRSGRYEEAALQLRAFIKRFPYHIDSYHHLGIIEMNLGHYARALKYFETGYRIGMLSIPEDFAGTLAWIHLANRPFLRAAHGYGLALERARRRLEAVDVYEQILALNPDDNQGIRYLLPSLYLVAQAPQKARKSLESHGADGMNLYTRCLLEIVDGRRREAVRWLCRGLSYNPHLPKLVLSRTIGPNPSDEHYVAIGSESEAAEYLRQNRTWLNKEPRAFLRRILAIEPLARRFERALELKSLLDVRDGLPPGKQRSANVTELFSLFDEDCIPDILDQCRDAL